MTSKTWQFGLHAVQTLLKTHPDRVLELRVQQGRQDERIKKALQLAERHGIPVANVPRKALDKIAAGNHQGVAALCENQQVQDEHYLMSLLETLQNAQGQDKTKHAPFVLVLDGVTDPHNLGACLRSADAAGVDVVVAPKDRSVGITPTVSKVACGAAESVPFVVVTNLARTLKEMQAKGVWVVGTAGEAENQIYDTDLTGPVALVMGAEEKGMRRLTREHCDVLAKLPMAGSVSSLNVSVATGVCLFEAVRQRQG